MPVRIAIRLSDEDRREIDLLRAVKGSLYPDLDGLAQAAVAVPPPLG